MALPQLLDRVGSVNNFPARNSDAPAGFSVEVLIKQLDADLPLPAAARPGDAGVDLHARQAAHLRPGARAVIPTGIAIALPEGWAGFVHPRSGLAARHGITLVNAPGTIDAAYRGEIAVTVLNTDGQEEFTIQRGDRIAQLIFQQVGKPRFIEVDKLPGSHRGGGGFGSSGIRQQHLAAGEGEIL